MYKLLYFEFIYIVIKLKILFLSSWVQYDSKLLKKYKRHKLFLFREKNYLSFRNKGKSEYLNYWFFYYILAPVILFGELLFFGQLGRILGI